MRHFILSLVFALSLFVLPLKPASAASGAVPKTLEAVTLKDIQSFLTTGSGRKVLFLYTSWCPYCKKQMEGFRLFHDEYKLENILPVSTDKNPEAMVEYLGRQTTFPFDAAYIYSGDSELRDFINGQGGNMGSGIPYFAVFENGRFLKDTTGLTHPEELVDKRAK